MSPGLVITGMGLISPLGRDVKEHWENLIAGKSGAGFITRFDASGLPVRIAAQAPDIDMASTLPRSVYKSSAPFMQYAFLAAMEAIESSGLKSRDVKDMGICMGSALSGAPELAQSGEEFARSKSGRISPHLVPRVLGNMGAAHLAIELGIRGPALTLSTACSAGGDAVMTACMLILAGETDGVVAMGGESILSPPIISSLAYAKALSRNNDNPAEASRPFDAARDGFVIGEGGGAIVIETEERAKKRNAPIFAAISGWGNVIDGYHITAPEPSGKGAAACMRKALTKAGLDPSDIDYVNAHGTATQLGDAAETRAIKEVFGEATPAISSTKGATGHLMGAGGLVELVTCAKAIEAGLIAPTINL
ncbi:MAG: beta-ketoacyl-[acyl-carrier-protein] synthase family protein, partial [Desulfovibrio sp.]|nr:beta-ketoacyl-[acyl-carrier-protein] synthase family protein [Desulfovibrio sp.]